MCCCRSVYKMTVMARASCVVVDQCTRWLWWRGPHRSLPGSCHRACGSGQVWPKWHDASDNWPPWTQLPLVPPDGPPLELLSGGGSPPVHPPQGRHHRQGGRTPGSCSSSSVCDSLLLNACFIYLPRIAYLWILYLFNIYIYIYIYMYMYMYILSFVFNDI